MLESKNIVIVGRMPDVGTTKLFSIVEKIEDLGGKPVPLIFPFHYNLLHMNWENGNYHLADLLRLMRSEIGFEEIPLLILGEQGLYTANPYFCEEKLNACILTDEGKIGDVLAFLLRIENKNK